MAAAAVAALISVSGCDTGREHLLVVYTAMEPQVVEAVEDGFEAAHPDIDVRMVVLSPEDALDRLREERGASQAEVWWGVPPGMLRTAATAGLLETSAPSWAVEVVAGPREEEGLWHTVSVSPYVFAFHEDHMARSRVPRDWTDLFHPRWAGEVLLLDPASDASTAFLMGAWIAREEERTQDVSAGFDWLLRLDAATAGYSADIDRLLDRLQSGEGSMAIVPLSTLGQAVHDRGTGFKYTVPESGSPLVVRGVAVLHGAESRPQADAFLEYLGGPGGRSAASLGGFWLPGMSGDGDNEVPPELAGVSGLQVWSVNYPHVIANLDAWLERWRQDVRGLGSPLP